MSTVLGRQIQAAHEKLTIFYQLSHYIPESNIALATPQYRLLTGSNMCSIKQ